MKALSAKQAANCENAVGHVCKCRCGGSLHGASRIAPESGRVGFEELPEEDLHHIAPKKPPKEKSKQLALFDAIS